MTKKLYYSDAYLDRCECEIVKIIKEGSKIFAILDETPFYPEGGGQPSDRGTINNVNVIDVYEKDGIIYHEVDEDLEIGKVLCSVDFERRFDFMQQHSGEHLLSGIIHKFYNGNNKGFHMGEDYVTMDIDIYPFTEEMIEIVENKVNDYIYMNEEFRTYVVSKEELNSTPSRKKIDVEGEIRIVEAKEMDCCPCCGTHVARTGEIGIIKIFKVEKYKGMSRIYLKCGKRALEEFKIKQEVLSSLSKKFSTDEKSLIKNICKQEEELFNLKKELLNLKKDLAKEESEKLMNEFKGNAISKIFKRKTFEEVKYIGEYLNEKFYNFVLVSLIDNNILFINNNLDIDCGKIFKNNIKKFNGKGGGSSARAQGIFENEDDLKKFYCFLCDYLK